MADSIQFRRGLRSTVKPLPVSMPGFIEDEQRLIIGKGDGTNAELPNKADMDNINSQMAENVNKIDTVIINLKYPPAPMIGAKGDGTDESGIIQNILDSLNEGDTLEVPPGVYACKNIILKKSIRIKGTYSLNNRNLNVGSIFKLCSNADFLFKIGGEDYLHSTDSMVTGINIEDIKFFNDLNPFFLTDALFVVEGAALCNFKNVMFTYSNSRTLRFRVFHDSKFENCLFRRCGKPNEDMIYIDEIVDNDVNLNTNNINFNLCHFEDISGSYFKSHLNSNLTFLSITDCKFEMQNLFWGTNSKITYLFDFGRVTGLIFTNCKLTHYTLEQYKGLFKIDTGASNSIISNQFNFSTSIPLVLGGVIPPFTKATVLFKNNIAQDDPVNLIINNSTAAVLIEPIIGSSNDVRNRRAVEEFIDSHKLASDLNLFQPDSSSLGIEQSVQKSTVNAEILAKLDLMPLNGYPSDIEIYARVKSTNIAEKISLFIDNIEKSFVSNISDEWGFIRFSVDFNTLQSNPNELRLVHTSNTGEIFFDGIYVVKKGTISMSSYPTTGIWKKGDRIINNNPAVGQPKSWICTVSGTPGTWISEGNL